MLDVDNHFREFPRHRIRRVLIVERYVALLDHLRQQGFERVVFVAHSQGTVITAELLRYVQQWHLLGAASAQKVDPSQTPDPSLAPDASPGAARCASSTPCAFRRSTPAWGTTPTRMTSMSTRPMCGLSCWLW